MAIRFRALVLLSSVSCSVGKTTPQVPPHLPTDVTTVDVTAMCLPDSTDVDPDDVDSTTAVSRAREVLGGEGPGLQVGSFRTIDRQGFIISLYSPSPERLGGGGLVWIDRQVTCNVLLVRYE